MEMTEALMARSSPREDHSATERAAMEAVMTNDADWVADVRRWYFSSQQPASNAAPQTAKDTPEDIGYEAAHPALQSRNWRHGPDAPRNGFGELI